MIRRQIDRLWLRITSQSRIIFTKHYRGGLKRRFLDQFCDKIEGVVPGVSREDIYIIATGLFAELRSIKDITIRGTIIMEGGYESADSQAGEVD